MQFFNEQLRGGYFYLCWYFCQKCGCQWCSDLDFVYLLPPVARCDGGGDKNELETLQRSDDEGRYGCGHWIGSRSVVDVPVARHRMEISKLLSLYRAPRVNLTDFGFTEGKL